MKLLNVAAAAAQQRPPFGPLSINWHSVGWTEGPEFEALGYTDGAAVTNWPNEVVAERDLATVNSTVTYVASSAGMGGNPSVSLGTATAGLKMSSAFVSALTYPASIVIIGRRTTGTFICEGLSSGLRNGIYVQSGTHWRIFAGSTERQEATATADTLKHLWVGTFDGSTGNDTLTIDGSLRVNADAGSNQITGLTLGNRYDFFTSGSQGEYCFWAIYSGDVQSDPLWPAFEAWAASHYGLTIA